MPRSARDPRWVNAQHGAYASGAIVHLRTFHSDDMDRQDNPSEHIRDALDKTQDCRSCLHLLPLVFPLSQLTMLGRTPLFSLDINNLQSGLVAADNQLQHFFDCDASRRNGLLRSNSSSHPTYILVST